MVLEKLAIIKGEIYRFVGRSKIQQQETRCVSITPNPNAKKTSNGYRRFRPHVFLNHQRPILIEIPKSYKSFENEKLISWVFVDDYVLIIEVSHDFGSYVKVLHKDKVGFVEFDDMFELVLSPIKITD